MKKVSSVVWHFFDRIEQNKRCVAVLCKLCDTEYKYFGNTTNLRSHLIKKHPIQWELRNTDFDGQAFDGTVQQVVYDDDNTNLSTMSTSQKKRKYSRNKDNSDVLENSDDQGDTEDNEATINLVRQMHDNKGSEEEWLEDDYTIEAEVLKPRPKNIRFKKIKRELVTPPRRVSNFYEQASPKTQKYHHYSTENMKKDECSVFGEYVANKLRNFKAPRTRGNLQQLITTLLWQAEYGLYDNAEAVKRVIMSSIQNLETDQSNVRTQNTETELYNLVAKAVDNNQDVEKEGQVEPSI